MLWKALSGVIHLCIGSAVQFHDGLHGLQAGRGTGTASFESKLFQQLNKMREEVLYEVFLGLNNSYDALDREKCMDILVG